MGHREHEAGAAGADRMADCDRATVDVDAFLVELEHAGRVKGDRGKSLVNLDQVEVACRDPSLFESVGERKRWNRMQPCVAVGAHPVSDYLGQRLPAQFPCPIL